MRAGGRTCRLHPGAFGLILLALLPACLPASVRAYELLNSRRPNGAYVFDVGLVLAGSTQSPSGGSWDAAFSEAAGRWNGASPLVDLQVHGGAPHDPCDTTDGVHTAQFVPDICGGDQFGSNTLAIARRIFPVGGGYTIDGAVHFKDSVAWDVYAGVFRGNPRDFRRVAVHELGHLLGLDHENVAVSIMDPIVGDLELPQLDDIDGLAALYDFECPRWQWAAAGIYADTLDIVHCFDTEAGLPLPAGGGVLPLGNSTRASPNAFVDIYRVRMPNGGRLTAQLSSSDWNPLLQLLDASLTSELMADWAPRGSTVTISRSLAAGSYAIVARPLFSGGIDSSAQGVALPTHYSLSLVPEPASAALGAAALVCLAALRAVRPRR